jgi:hypothetical protein
MLGANASINSCAADSADHVDIVSRCCQVYDSLKEFCPQRSLLGAAACWIVKPNCSSRKVGVRLTDDMLELAFNGASAVQQRGWRAVWKAKPLFSSHEA